LEDTYGDIVYSFSRSATELVGAGFCQYLGKPYFYIRIFVPSLTDPQVLIPTRKGINLPLDLLDEVLDGVSKVADVISTNKVVKRIARPGRQQLRIGVSEHRDNVYVYIRIFKSLPSALNADSEGYVPTKRGVTAPLSAYDNLAEMLRTLKARSPSQ